MRLSALISLLPLFLFATAHPGGHDSRDELARRKFLAHANRSINDCRDKLETQGIEGRAIERRAALAESLRARRGLPQRRAVTKRDLASVLATDHKSDRTDLNSSSTGADIFTGDLACVLQPEVTIGPYWVSGELVRTDIRDDEEGIPLFTDYQVIDVSTCEPIPDVYIDTWHANATGVYAGVVANGNGDSTDAANLNATHGRGIGLTDADGVAYFETNFPGHYTGRAPHIHVLATIGATLLPNNTISGGNVAHIGQIFLDQSLITAVEKNSPYTKNTLALTLNADDSILAEEAAVMDPFIQYVWLSDDPSDGILSWITIGIDPTAEYVTNAAAEWTENGGVANANAGGPGGPGGGGGPGQNGTTGAVNGTAGVGNGTAPSSSGTIVSSFAAIVSSSTSVTPSSASTASSSGTAGAATKTAANEKAGFADKKAGFANKKADFAKPKENAGGPVECGSPGGGGPPPS